ncbi:LysR family transcriptional regulator (plasmid) [Aminobacter sp. Y103A]|nr:LysR family transcriptional regulator [Aminobacter sp. SS-2016]
MPLKSLSNADLKLLSVFRTVARCGGFALAQADLNVSQATISIQIKDLETRLGLTLCQRGRGGFALTEDGQRVYDASNALFNHIDDFLSHALGEERLVGELQIAVVDNTIFHPTFQLADVVRSFREIAHSVDITMHVAAPNQLEYMVLSGQAHMAIGFFARRLAQLEYEPSFTSEMNLYCSDTHPLFKIPDSELTEEMISSVDHAQRGYISDEQLRDKERGFRYSARAQNIEGLAHLILSGRYLAFLPEHHANIWVSTGRMRPLMAQEYAYCSYYEIIRRKAVPRTPAEKKFFELLRVKR